MLQTCSNERDEAYKFYNQVDDITMLEMEWRDMNVLYYQYMWTQPI